MSKFVFNFNMNFQSTVLIRKKKTNQMTIDTLKDIESKLQSGEISLSQPWILVSRKLYNQLERVQRKDKRHSCRKGQALKNKVSKGGFQELPEKERLKVISL